jgi:predicted ArsR family transcriptional regulator
VPVRSPRRRDIPSPTAPARQPAPPVDISASEFTATVSAITNAFGDPTRRGIYLFVHEHDEGVTAAQVADRFRLHANVARHHLEKLAAGGYVEVVVERTEGAGAGRPSKHYRPVGERVALDLAVKTDDLVLALLGRALGLLPAAQAQRMAEEVGMEYGRAMAASMAAEGGQRSFRAALHAVADALTAHGFAAHTEKSGNQLRIVSEHCPFGTTAVDNPVICAVDRGMVKGMLASLYGDTAPALESSLPKGDDVCVTSF